MINLMQSFTSRTKHSHRRGISLLETLLAAGIVGVAFAILLPMLAHQRLHAGSTVTQQNIRIVGDGVTLMTFEDRFFPPSYVNGANPTGIEWNLADQLLSHPNPENGYVHFSGMLLARGFVPDEGMFTSPLVPRGGAPRTNPGPDPADWEPGQVNDLGQPVSTTPNQPQDRQARRLVFAGNNAFMPRNALAPASQLGTRRNYQLVPRRLWRLRQAGDAAVGSSDNPILLGELGFASAEPDRPWVSVASALGSGDAPPDGDYVVKSRFPIEPFYSPGSPRPGLDLLWEPVRPNVPFFKIFQTQSIFEVICGGRDRPSFTLDLGVNKLGVHNPGRASWVYRVDGSTERMTPRETIIERAWGRRIHSLTGPDTAVSLEFDNNRGLLPPPGSPTGCPEDRRRLIQPAARR
ncbi:MAG: hypothetical protein AAFN41_03275 [Planctomycetota bacterium]